MLEKSNTYFMGYRLLIDHGVALKPRWWDIPRRLGWSKSEIYFTTPVGSVIIDNLNRCMTVRQINLNDLLNNEKLIGLQIDSSEIYGISSR
jgi:hypothetical protein